MVCDVCKYRIPTDAGGYHHYLLLKYGNAYEPNYDNKYEINHKDHKHAREDVTLCNSCYDMFMTHFAVDGEFLIPKAIPLLQSKRFILEVFRRHDAKNRFKR